MSFANIPLVSLCAASIVFFSNDARAEFAPPAGIFSLGAATDNPGTTADERLAGIRDYDFVAGFTLRVFWRDIEPAQGAYNFAVIDEAIRQAGAIGQRVNLEVLGDCPQYVLDGAGSTYTNHRDELSPTPWDSFTQQRHAALQSALANHVVDDSRGLAMNQHPVLASIDATPAGLNFGVRDLNNGIRRHPDYTQQRYIDAVVNGTAVSRTAFPNHTGYIAFFGFNDGQPGTPVDQQLIALLDAQYNAPGKPSLAFFIENFSDTGPVPSGAPGGAGNNLLAWTQLGGSTMMQALDSWLIHRPDRDEQLASLNPATGIALGYNNFGTRFFELYVPDLDQPVNGALDAAGRPILDDLRAWNTILVPEPGISAGLFLLAVPLLRRRRAQPRSR